MLTYLKRSSAEALHWGQKSGAVVGKQSPRVPEGTLEGRKWAGIPCSRASLLSASCDFALCWALAEAMLCGTVELGAIQSKHPSGAASAWKHTQSAAKAAIPCDSRLAPACFLIRVSRPLSPPNN